MEPPVLLFLIRFLKAQRSQEEHQLYVLGRELLQQKSAEMVTPQPEVSCTTGLWSIYCCQPDMARARGMLKESLVSTLWKVDLQFPRCTSGPDKVGVSLQEV